MNTPFNGLPQGADRIVYVREVAVAELPDEVREQMDGLEVIWSVHGADGRQPVYHHFARPALRRTPARERSVGAAA